MSHWNHRILQETLPTGELWFSIRETFYNDDGSIYAYTEQPIDVSGYSVDEIRETLQWMLTCLDKPVLVENEVEFVDSSLGVDEDDAILDQS